MAREQIGNYHLTTTQRFRINSEYARWFDEIEVEPCVVPVYAEVDEQGQVHDFMGGPAWKVSGSVVSSDWSPCFGGVPFADGRNQNLGEIKEYTCHPYAHALAKSILACNSQVTLLPTFEAREVPFEYKGDPHTTYGIFRKGS